MATKILYDLYIRGEAYKDRRGNDRHEYWRVGRIIEGNSGRPFMRLQLQPLQGLSWNGIVYMTERGKRDRQTGAETIAKDTDADIIVAENVGGFVDE